MVRAFANFAHEPNDDEIVLHRFDLVFSDSDLIKLANSLRYAYPLLLFRKMGVPFGIGRTLSQRESVSRKIWELEDIPELEAPTYFSMTEALIGELRITYPMGARTSAEAVTHGVAAYLADVEINSKSHARRDLGRRLGSAIEKIPPFALHIRPTEARIGSLGLINVEITIPRTKLNSILTSAFLIAGIAAFGVDIASTLEDHPQLIEKVINSARKAVDRELSQLAKRQRMISPKDKDHPRNPQDVIDDFVGLFRRRRDE